MEQKKFEFILEARQAIAHHSETLGNTSVLMRRRIRQRDGSFASVPVISGDTMRHGIREASTYAFLDAAGLLDDPNLSEQALRLLFSGGMITGSAGGSVKLGDYREMVDLIPTLGLLGGCAQNRVIPGRLLVDDALLICKETEHLLPDWCVDWVFNTQADNTLVTCRACVEETQRVRMDPSLDPAKRNLLRKSAADEVTQRLLLSEEASSKDDVVEKDKAKSTMLPRSFEVVVAGSLFYWSVTATCFSELDRDTFMVACATFLSNARVGGKRATGHGLLKPVAGYQVDLLRPVERTETLKEPSNLASRCGTVFTNHIVERADRIKSFLERVIS